MIDKIASYCRICRAFLVFFEKSYYFEALNRKKFKYEIVFHFFKCADDDFCFSN